MKEVFSANMSNGPQIYSFRGKIFYYGACRIVTFTEMERGKELKVTVNTSRPVCWIELWPAVYDGKDWVRWTTERGQTALARTGDKPQSNPSLTWKIEPGDYTLYFVTSSLTRQVKDETLDIQIEIV
jgi:hypothetical protein